MTATAELVAGLAEVLDRATPDVIPRVARPTLAPAVVAYLVEDGSDLLLAALAEHGLAGPAVPGVDKTAARTSSTRKADVTVSATPDDEVVAPATEDLPPKVGRAHVAMPFETLARRAGLGDGVVLRAWVEHAADWCHILVQGPIGDGRPYKHLADGVYVDLWDGWDNVYVEPWDGWDERPGVPSDELEALVDADRLHLLPPEALIATVKQLAGELLAVRGRL